jgi:hypothetical protein
MWMRQDWLPKGQRLAADPVLRKLQLRWITDEIWMRRVVFVVVIAAALVGLVYGAVESSARAAIGGGVTALAILTAYYFGGRQRKDS